MKPLLIVNILLAVTIITLTVAYNTTSTSKDVVYTMCQDSRMYDTTSESTCAELQDYYGVEYICAENNSLIENKCHIDEVK